jgi:hypothetical protein
MARFALRRLQEMRAEVEALQDAEKGKAALDRLMDVLAPAPVPEPEPSRPAVVQRPARKPVGSIVVARKPSPP